jgi:hypothetical protein
MTKSLVLLLSMFFIRSSIASENYDLSGLKPYLDELNKTINTNIKKHHVFEQNPNCIAKFNPCSDTTFGLTSCSQCIDGNVKTTFDIRYIGVNIVRNSIIISGSIDITSRLRGRGEIGAHIQETAYGTIDPAITIRFTHEDGKIRWEYASYWRWLNTPRLDIFGFIPVTVQSLADDAVSDMMNSFDDQVNSLLNSIRF